jgi:predicted phosphate transport protein (TIGR00153 family)
MGFLFSRTNKVLKMVEEYLASAGECMRHFMESFEEYFKNGLSDAFDETIAKTHRAESMSDDLRREIEISMYERGLIPESRGDILGLLETFDKIPNKAESVLYQIQSEILSIPEGLKPDFKKLVVINHSAYEDVARCVEELFKNIGKVRHIINEVDKKESESDAMERELIKKIFSNPSIDKGDKILLKELVIEIGNISDRCEDASDRLNITAVKRYIG